jgi:hypothetical protein
MPVNPIRMMQAASMDDFFLSIFPLTPFKRAHSNEKPTTRQRNGPTDIDVIVVREAKNLKG